MGSGHYRRIFITAAALSLLMLALQQPSTGHFEPSSPPGWPAGLPPETGSLPTLPPLQNPRNQPVPEAAVTYSLPAGWSIISFPFARVTRAKGFTRMLYYYSGGIYHAQDPVNSPGSIDTRNGYVAYADRATTVTVSGTINTIQVRSGDLESGWNLIGCPCSSPVPWRRMVMICGSEVKLISTPGLQDWISPAVFTFEGEYKRRDITSEGASLAPMTGTWVFAHHPVRVVLRGRREGSPGGDPRINELDPQPVQAGDALAIRGSGFGSAPGQVIIQDVPIPRGDLLSWSDTMIEARVPIYAHSGHLLVLAHRTPSNSVPLAVDEKATPERNGSAPAAGTLIGRVQSSSGAPVGGAHIVLENGLSTFSAEDGSYVIKEVPPGEHTIQATAYGYNRAQGLIHLLAGKSDAVLITLTTLFTPPQLSPDMSRSQGSSPGGESHGESSRGTLHIVADAYDDGYHRWFVHRIDAHEWGNFEHHWYNSWDSDYGDAWYDLNCDEAIVGKTFIIEIQWRSKDGGGTLKNSWYRTMTTSDQTETFDSPD